jgi:hypothetical protein
LETAVVNRAGLVISRKSVAEATARPAAPAAN